MTQSGKNTAKQVAKVALLLAVAAVLTLTGWYFSWTQVHLRDWKGDVGIALLLPYAAVNRAFQWFTHSEQLSVSMYHLAFLLGSVGQVLYYYALYILMRRLVRIVRGH